MFAGLKKLLVLATAGVLALATPAQSNDVFLAGVQANFARWDQNHDGVLSGNELDLVVADPQTAGTNAAIVAALKRASRHVKMSVPPLTLENIAFCTARRQPDLGLMFREGWKRIAGATNRNLFVGGLPKLETIHQGRLGNCFCLAPLGAMVHRNPAEVAARFTLATNGNYSVRLGKKTVEVPPPTDAEIAMTSSNEHEGIWVNIYEMAVGAARNDDRPADQRVTAPLDTLARGGSAGTMLAALTGHEITRVTFKFAKMPVSATNDVAAKLNSLRKKIATAVAENRLMTTGTVKPTTPGLTPNHAYAVLGYEAERDAVRLWNPHGQNFKPKGVPGPETGYPTTNGIFAMPLREFVQQFSGMAFELHPSVLP